MKKIIDISQWNNVTDWNLVKTNVDAVIIRMGFTYSVNGYMCADDKYVQHRKACEAMGIPFSLYYFTNAITEAEATREAELLAYECRYIKRFVLPVFVDSEKVSGHGRADNISVDQRTKCLRAFCSTLQRNGIPAGIYCNADWIKNHIDRSKLPFSLWLAQWSDAPEYNDYVLWQYTSKGSIPGIEGDVDISTDATSSKAPADRLIECLAAEIGYCEKRSGDLTYLYDKTANKGSSNYTKYGYEMHNIQPQNMDYPAAWCQAFLSWGFVQTFGLDRAKYLLCGDIDDYTVLAAQRFKNAQRWFSSPARGDLVFFGDNGKISHVGIVETASASSIGTIEGNSGDKVQRHTYAKTNSRIIGYGRPRWE